MSVAEFAPMIGRRGFWSAGTAARGASAGFTVAVTIANVRESFGRLDYLIRPLTGSGEAWVNANAVRLADVSAPGDYDRLTGHPESGTSVVADIAVRRRRSAVTRSVVGRRSAR